MDKIIYVDNAATTKISDSVLKAIEICLRDTYGNPSSIHSVGRNAKQQIESSRETIAKTLRVKKDEIYFTSGGSESNNWAIKGVVASLKKEGKNHIITTNIEHPSVLNACKAMEDGGFEVTYLPVDRDGYVSAKQVEDSIKKNTALVSVMFANNEIGTIQPIKEIGKLCKQKKVLFHTDAVQAFGNIQICVDELCIDLMSISGHKIYSPKGIGMLYVRRGIELTNLIDGGRQEYGKRAGTENIVGIVAICQSIVDASKDILYKSNSVTGMREYIINKIITDIPSVKLNGGRKCRLPGNINLSFEGVESESLILGLDRFGICVSGGSACSAGSLKPSHVLMALGMAENLAYATIRMSINEELTKEDADYIVDKLSVVIERLRSISPTW